MTRGWFLPTPILFYYLTIPVPVGKSKIDDGYDIPAISAGLDFINLMSYDMHGGWETVTGHNSPLYAGDQEIGEFQRQCG